MKYILLAIVNMFITIYFARKKWYAASLSFAGSILVLFYLMLFTTDIPILTDGFIDIVGLDAYNTVSRILLAHMHGPLSPLLAVIVLCVLSVIVVSLKTVERIIYICKAHHDHRYARTCRPHLFHLRFTQRYYTNRKLYLSNCTMLC